jgi:hypothetical protein
MKLAQIPKAGALFDIVERNYEIVQSLRLWGAQSLESPEAERIAVSAFRGYANMAECRSESDRG